jgi:hypothetical protein
VVSFAIDTGEPVTFPYSTGGGVLHRQKEVYDVEMGLRKYPLKNHNCTIIKKSVKRLVAVIYLKWIEE